MKFMIEARSAFDFDIPAQDFGYTAIEAALFHNWRCGAKVDSVLLCRESSISAEMLQKDIVPVGSVEFCMRWFAAMGVIPHPLNIPVSIQHLVRRKIITTTTLENTGTLYYGKDMDVIKASRNGVYREYHGKTPMIFSELVPAQSEWRLFVLNRMIVGIKNYAGDPLVVPDFQYCQTVADQYGKENPAFTLDVMIREDGQTDILELHDFFACGLYGFEDLPAIRQMLIRSCRHVLNKS